jgi:hypothetical protein
VFAAIRDADLGGTFASATAPNPTALRILEGAALFTSEALTLTATVPLESDGKDVRTECTLSQGDTAVFALERVTDETPPHDCPHAEAEREFTATVAC